MDSREISIEQINKLDATAFRMLYKTYYKALVCYAIQIAGESGAAEDIVQELKNQFRREVSSDEIGELVLRRLKDIDKVAYIRFASVYRDFNDIDSFVRIISELNEEK